MDKSHARSCAFADWKGEENRLAKEGKVMVYENQKAKAMEIQSCFLENISHVTLVASPQWGKTGVALYLMYLMTTLPDDDAMIHPDNTFVICGMSDKDWLKQTKQRMPRIFRDRVYHRNNIHYMIEHLSRARDCLIVVDECHFGSVVGQTVSRCLHESRIWNIDLMLQRNIKVLSISATPTNFLLDAREWGSQHRTIIASGKDCPEYVGFHTLLQENRIQSANINVAEDVAKIFRTIDDRWGDANPRYHIFRVTDTCMENSNICNEIRDRGYEYDFHNSDNRINDIDEKMKTAPTNHYFILIKGFWKAAKTLTDRYVGICYEATKDDTAAAQGLGGRLLGFGKQRGQNAPVLFGNPESYKKYVEIIDRGCDYLQTKKYTSGTLKIRNGVVAKKTASVAHGKEVGLTLPITDQSQTTTCTPPSPPVKAKKATKTKEPPTDGLMPVAVKMSVIPENTKYATTIATYTPEEFMRRFNIESVPDKAENLSKMLNKNGFAARVSFQRNSIATVGNLVNYYKRPEWAKSPYHVSRLEPTGPITVITRDTDLLAAVQKGDYVMAHSAKTGQNQLYKF